jgi:hypothetical protein
VWAAIARRIPEDGQVALYRGLFMFGVVRIVSWSVWAHALHDHAYDLRWGGPDWLTKVPPSPQTTTTYVVGVLGVGVACTFLWLFVIRRVGLPAPSLAGPTSAEAVAAVPAADDDDTIRWSGRERLLQRSVSSSHRNRSDSASP